MTAQGNLERLVGIEAEASAHVAEARLGADAAVETARESADSMLRKAVEAETRRLRALSARNRETADAETASELVAFRESLEKTIPDFEAFRGLCDSFIQGKA